MFRAGLIVPSETREGQQAGDSIKVRKVETRERGSLERVEVQPMIFSELLDVEVRKREGI